MPAILIADDEPGLLQLVKRHLAGVSSRIETVANGHRAIDALEREPFDILIVDLFMPDKDGIETITEVRRRWPQTKIIAISGGGCVGVSHALRMASVLGADRVLAKPFTLGDLARDVSELFVTGARAA